MVVEDLLWGIDGWGNGLRTLAEVQMRQNEEQAYLSYS